VNDSASKDETRSLTALPCTRMRCSLLTYIERLLSLLLSVRHGVITACQEERRSLAPSLSLRLDISILIVGSCTDGSRPHGHRYMSERLVRDDQMRLRTRVQYPPSSTCRPNALPGPEGNCTLVDLLAQARRAANPLFQTPIQEESLWLSNGRDMRPLLCR
jgi:hypothetical protein